jgi:CheB methylesterase/DDE domain
MTNDKTPNETPPSESEKFSAASSLDFLVVGIGASAGGIPALLRLFENMPSDAGVAFVIVLHLSPKHESVADEVLQRVTKIRVIQVTTSTRIEKNCVYLISPSNNLSMEDGQLRVTHADRPTGRPSAIDLFFRSLAVAHGAARRYFEKAIDQNGSPETVTIDKSGANLAGLRAINAKRETPIKIRQTKYLNNVVEQDHRAIKRVIRPMLGFKDFHCARVILGGIEIMHMIAKGQMKDKDGSKRSFAQQFYALAM